MSSPMFHRHPANPILTACDAPAPATAVLNPGVAYVDGEIVLLVRVEDRRGLSYLQVARSATGVDNWRWDDVPLLVPGLPEWPYEEWGCEDARITQMAEHEWIITYTAYSRYGPAVALATTTDFRTARRMGIVLSPNNKDCIIFPDQFEEKWLMLHRPVAGDQEHIWYASSDDLLHWSHPGVLLPERGGPWWDGLKLGAGAPPIRTEEGWLLIYHGVKEIANRPLYRLGLALLDRTNHRKVIARASEWIFSPEAPYERQGDAPNIVYTCGAHLCGDEVWMYYGAADYCICLATAKLAELLEAVRRSDYLPEIGR
ncbi:MAG TPA: glycosidase [Armatimonadota bacterium]|nr:glycosidase [Armatimonadota bacterium]